MSATCRTRVSRCSSLARPRECAMQSLESCHSESCHSESCHQSCVTVNIYQRSSLSNYSLLAFTLSLHYTPSFPPKRGCNTLFSTSSFPPKRGCNTLFSEV